MNEPKNNGSWLIPVMLTASFGAVALPIVLFRKRRRRLEASEQAQTPEGRLEDLTQRLVRLENQTAKNPGG